MGKPDLQWRTFAAAGLALIYHVAKKPHGEDPDLQAIGTLMHWKMNRYPRKTNRERKHDREGSGIQSYNVEGKNCSQISNSAPYIGKPRHFPHGN